MSFRSVAIELTARCNQRCSYCYNAWRNDPDVMGELDLDALRLLLTDLARLGDLRHVTLTGGEPFLRPDLHELIELIAALGLGVVIITNGGRICAADVERLSGYGHLLSVQLTLAGACAATHDLHCGAGSFEHVTRALEALTKAGIPTGGSFLCTAQNFQETAAIFEKFAGYEVRQVAFNRFNPSGYSTAALHELMPTRSQVVEALEAAERSATERGQKVFCTMPIPPCVVDTQLYPHIKFGHCSAGAKNSEPAIGTDGRLRLCTLQRDSVGPIEVLEAQSLTELDSTLAFRSSIPEFCLPCPLAKRCLGGCGAAAQWVLGSARELDPFVAQHVMLDFDARSRRHCSSAKVSPGLEGNSASRADDE